MSTPQNSSLRASNLLIDYLPAILKENKSGWLIEYYAADPATGELKRKQIRLKKLIDRYKSVKDARIHAQRIVFSLNQKLAGGWNPFFTSEDARLYTDINTVFELFLNEKTKELRAHSLRSYNSFVNILQNWTNTNYPELLCSMFSKLIAVRYMDYIYSERNVGITTYNNHIKMGRAFFNWALEKCYVKENPFEKIKSKPKPIKTRVVITKPTLTQVVNYLSVNNPNFLTVCRLIYSSLIRPNEIRQIQIKHIDLQRKCIIVPGSISKNHKTRIATITPETIEELKKMNIDKYPVEYYVFGSYITPSATMAGNGCYNEKWEKMRNALKLSSDYQLYSLRDTGMTDMIKGGIDDVTVMNHADHSSLEITTIYTKHKNDRLIEEIYNKLPEL